MGPSSKPASSGASSKSAPSVQRLHYPRRKFSQNPLGSLWDTLVTFVLWHYLLWGLAGGGASLLVYVFCVGPFLSMSWLIFHAGVVAYVVQLVAWRPQNRAGVPRWLWHSFRFASVFDSSLRYGDCSFIRELDPETEEARSDAKYLFAWAPHGIMGLCRGGSGSGNWAKMYPGVYGMWGSFGAAFYLPGIREFSFLTGCVDAGRKTLARVADTESIHLIPGGIREMLLTDPYSKVTRLCFRDRFGFAKLAWEKDLKLVPVFCFGEKFCYDKVLIRPAWLRKILLRNQLTGTGLVGRFGCTFLPKNDKKLGWVFGRPIDPKKFESYEKMHAHFLDEMARLFETYKADFDYGEDEVLEIVNTDFVEKMD